MKIGIIGAGRLGLTFALLCEKAGYEVIVSDKREDYVYNLNHNICNTNEPFIQQMLFGVQKFSATTDNIEIIKTLSAFCYYYNWNVHNPNSFILGLLSFHWSSISSTLQKVIKSFNVIILI